MNYLSFLGIAFLLAGCASTSPSAGEIALTKNDSGKTINASANQTITINLESNATTGYKWNLVIAPDPRILKLVSSKYNEPTSSGGQPRLGEGGSEIWQFQAIGAGTTMLKLQYFRPFDPGQVGGEFAITILAK